MSNIYTRRPGFWGIISIPQSYVLEILAGRIKLNAPEKVTTHNIYPNPYSLSLDIIISSEHEIPDVTYESFEGMEMKKSLVSWDMHHNMILGSI